MIAAAKTKKPNTSTASKQTKTNNGVSIPAKTLSIQPKLTIGKPDDKYVLEADKIADQVVSMPERKTIQRKYAASEEEEKVQQKPLVARLAEKQDKDESKTVKVYKSFYEFSSSGIPNFQKLTIETIEKKDAKSPIIYKYVLNGKNISDKALNDLLGLSTSHPLINVAIAKLLKDNKQFKGDFPNYYYEEFGKFIFNKAIKFNKKKKLGYSVTEVWQVIDTKTWKYGSAIFHLYENVVGKNYDTGYDKLQHFVASAYWQYKSAGTLSEILQWGAEFYDHFVNEGFDHEDMKANRKGEAFGEELEQREANDNNRKGKIQKKAITSGAWSDSLTVLQAKLNIGKPNDKYEQEADRIADQVVAMPERKTVQRKYTAREEEEKVQQKPLVASITPWVQKQEIVKEDKEVQPKLQLQSDKEDEQIDPIQTKRFSTATETPSSSLESKLNSSKSGGNSLPKNTRSFMENGIGADFGNVKIHTDDNAVQMSKEIGAQAFTHGNHVYFNSGKYNPESSSGKHLLAHELVHTVQQKKNMIHKDVIQKRLCITDTTEILKWYSIGNGKNVFNYSYSPQWVDQLLEITGRKYIRLGSRIKKEKKINEDFITLVCYAQRRMNIEPNGKVDNTTIKAYKVWLKNREYKNPKIKPTQKEIGNAIVEEAIGLNKEGNANSGIHYAGSYYAKVLKYRRNKKKNAYLRDYNNNWKPSFWTGYADPKYWDKRGDLLWRLRPKVRASEGIKKWLNGLTIAECLSGIVAIQLNVLRKTIGDKKFDNLYSSSNLNKPRIRYLEINTKKDNFLKHKYVPLRRRKGVKRFDLKKGDWCILKNHAAYLLKHLDGSWYGFNIIYIGNNEKGERLWSGFGGSEMTLIEIYRDMAEEFNSDRTERDYWTIINANVKSKRTGKRMSWMSLSPPGWKGIYQDFLKRGNLIPNRFIKAGKMKDIKITDIDNSRARSHDDGKRIITGGGLRDCRRLSVHHLKSIKRKLN